MKKIDTIYKIRFVLFDCVIPKNLNWKLNPLPFAQLQLLRIFSV